MMDQAPEISVGIVSGSGLTFTLNGQFTAELRKSQAFRTVDCPAAGWQDPAQE